jgi:maleate isomerase
LGASRIGIVTPFDDAANENVRKLYEAWGFEVSGIKGLNRPGFSEIPSTSDRETAQAFAEVAGDNAEALVQVGTGLPMLHHIDALEDRFDLPIVAANLASYWQGLRAAGIDDGVAGAGRLFKL